MSDVKSQGPIRAQLDAKGVTGSGRLTMFESFDHFDLRPFSQWLSELGCKSCTVRV